MFKIVLHAVMSFLLYSWKASLIYCLLLLLALPLGAQSPLITTLDSLESIEDRQLRMRGLTHLLSQQDTSIASASLGTIFQTIGYQYYVAKNYEKALYYIQKAIAIRAQYKDENPKAFNESRFRLALIFGRQQQPKQKELTLLEIIQDEGGDDYTARSYRVLATSEVKKGDLHKALHYVNLALVNKKLCEHLDDELLMRLKAIRIYAIMYNSNFSNTDNPIALQAVKTHQKRIEEKASFSKKVTPKYVHEMYNNAAIVYDAYGELELALAQYLKSKNFYLQQQDTIYYVDVLINIGVLYSKLGKHQQAKSIYQQVISLSTDPEQASMAYNNMGYYSPSLSTKDKLSYFQKAITIVLQKNTASFTLPTLKEIKESKNAPYLLSYLTDLTTYYVVAFKEQQDVSYLEKAKASLYLIDQLISFLRYTSASELSKLFWIQKGVNTYQLGVEVCFLLNQPDEAFYFMEKNKTLLLQEHIRTLQAKWQLPVPPSILEREYELHYQMQELFIALQQAPNELQLQEQYITQSRDYIHFMDSLQMRYPDYASIKKDIQIVSIDVAMQKHASANEAFIEYILNEETGYGIYCAGTEKILFKLHNVSALQQELQLLKSYLTKRLLPQSEITKFKQLSHAVFKKLFPFQDAFTKIAGKKLTIIADQSLQNFPFEALVTNLEEKLAKSYLIQHTELSYLPSCSVFEQIQQKDNHPPSKILGIAPITFEQNKLATLSGSLEMMEQFAQINQSKVLLEKAATKSNFLHHLDNYQVIHLNTHAGIDSLTQEPWIAFRKNTLTLNELYGKKNQAELIVLDACNTNDGALEQGEGIINLSRGFFFNGAQSVLASHWNVNEQSGNQILTAFYTQLQQGHSKSYALQQAKIHYLNKHDFSEILPYYWATFTLSGSTDTLDLSASNLPLLLLITLLLVIGSLFIYKKYFH